MKTLFSVVIAGLFVTSTLLSASTAFAGVVDAPKPADGDKAGDGKAKPAPAPEKDGKKDDAKPESNEKTAGGEKQ